ncbi:MAG: hypothetical protein HYT73_00305 [Candidatus Aenigmarchaeota archaeon]|nr:hypothetical protein [Candidatus Aenigmarchaeota archaeon]
MATFDDARKKYLDVLYLFDKKRGTSHHKLSLDMISDELEVAKNNSNLVDFDGIMKRLEEIESGLN